MNVMILCAGEGRRLRPFTEQSPKPAIPFLSVPLAYFSLYLLDKTPIDTLVINTHHLPEQVQKTFKDIPAQWKNLIFTLEKESLLGSGGGIHLAKPYLQGKGDFFVMNGDEVILPHQLGVLDEMRAFHQWHGGIATLMTIDHPEVGHKFGGAWTEQGETRVQCFSKIKPAGSQFQGHHFVGVMLLSEKVFKYFKSEIVEENILYETLSLAMSHKDEVHVFKTQAEWFETGNPEDFLKATEICSKALADPNNDSVYWIQYLQQVIRYFGKDRYLIEKGSAQLEQIQKIVKSIRS